MLKSQLHVISQKEFCSVPSKERAIHRVNVMSVASLQIGSLLSQLSFNWETNKAPRVGRASRRYWF